MTPSESGPDPVDLELAGAADQDGEVRLPTFVVLARFPEPAPTAEQAEASVRSRLTAAHGLYDDVRVERREDDGTWLLEVRFVVVSLHAHTAVEGVAGTLSAAGLSPDEVWVPPEPELDPEPA